jgi:ribosome-associated protein
MTKRKIDAALLDSELVYAMSRSSGPGGQNVNKVNSKVTLKFDVSRSRILTDDEKTLLLSAWASKLTGADVLMITAQDKRSQLQNKEAAVGKFEKMLSKAFTKKKVRKATKPSKSAIENRISGKKLQSEKKQWRQKM